MTSQEKFSRFRILGLPRNCKVPIMALAMVAVLVSMPIGMTQTLPPSPDQVIEEIEEEVDGALEQVYGDELIGPLLPTPESLRANAIMDTVESQMNAVKANFLLGNMDFRDFDDVDIDELTIREGRLPESVFFHSELLDELPDIPTDPPALPGGGGGADDCTDGGGGSNTGDTRTDGDADKTTNDGTSSTYSVRCPSSSTAPSGTQAVEDIDPLGSELEEEAARRAKQVELMQLGHEWTDYRDINVLSSDAIQDLSETQSTNENTTRENTENQGGKSEEGGFGTMSSFSGSEETDFSEYTTDSTLTSQDWSKHQPFGTFTPTVRENNPPMGPKSVEGVCSSCSGSGDWANVIWDKPGKISGEVGVLGLFKSDTEGSNRLGPVVRASSSETSTGFSGYMANMRYSATEDEWWLRIQKRDNDVTTSLGDSNPINTRFDQDWHWIRLYVDDINDNVYVFGKVWRYGDPEPDWMVIGVDWTNKLSSGHVGWGGFASKSGKHYVSSMLISRDEGANFNSPPTVPSRPTGPTSGDTSQTLTYSTSATDPDGDNVRYQFNWGDGTTSWTNWVSSGQSASASHSWSSSGSYDVIARAQDTEGAISGWSLAHTVLISDSNSPPNTPSRPSGATSGETSQTLTYSTSATDPDGDNVRYQFDWGDGTNSWTGWRSSGQTGSASKAWSSPGTYSVTARAQDVHGAVSSWSPARTVTISGSCSGSTSSPSDTLFKDNFADGAGDWDLTGIWHVTTQRAYDGTCSLWYGQSSTGDYDTGSRNLGSATSPIINLPVASNPVLTYRSWYETEPDQNWDLKWVQILSASGQQLGQFSPVTGPMKQWTLESHSLSQWAGQGIRVQFNFDTRDAAYNDFEGWYVDDVRIRVSASNMPDQDDRSVNVFTTEYYRSSGSGAAWHVYQNDDGFIGGSAANRLEGDIVEKTFRVNMEAHDGVEEAYLLFHGRQRDCPSNANSFYTHSFEVNGVVIATIDPCALNTSLSWHSIKVPIGRLQDGANTFAVYPHLPGSRGIDFTIDTSSPGVDSHIVEGGSSREGELRWRLFIQNTGDFEYDILYRFWAVQYIDENDQEHWEYAYEGFVHFDYPGLDSLHFVVYDDRNGDRWRQWQTVTWQQNDNWHPNNRDGGTWWWAHRAYDPNQMHNGNQGEVPKQTSKYYSWYRVEGGVRTPSGETHSWREIVLVENKAPSWEQTGEQNPPAHPVASRQHVRLNLKVEAYWDVHEIKSYGHTPAQINREGNFPSPGRDNNFDHSHERIGVEAHFLEYSERVEQFWDAYAIAKKIVDAYVDWLEWSGVDDWLLKKVKISKAGGATSDILTAAQTGRLAYLNAYDTDGWFTVPTTDIGIHPKGILAAFGPKGVIAAGAATAIDAVPQTGHKIPKPPGCGSPPTVGCGPSTEWTWNHNDIFG